MVFLKKALLGLGALILIFIGGSGTQSSSLLLQGGGFIGLIIGLVVLYIFGKMAWRAMGCLPSFLVVISIIAFILYAIGGFNNGIGGVGQSLRSFLGMQANSQRQMPQNGQIMIIEDEYAPAIDENFSSDIGSQAEVQPQAEQKPNAFQQLMSSAASANRLHRHLIRTIFRPYMAPPALSTATRSRFGAVISNCTALTRRKPTKPVPTGRDGLTIAVGKPHCG